ncbi:hypothetical protein D0Z07_2507 [Hyphodiscus hymeniophilus]|uniref:Uncharacterized protein n=1 Tax=Hyphodiscus hymeniophilus TaxID=353542 RepID=A0A9P6VNQ0_9HELO|nr:hypothetical protein D0Z07_2507 [Hyphodiscus hymeniophilus]
MEYLTTTLSRTSLDSDSSGTTFVETPGAATTDSCIGGLKSVSDITSTEEFPRFSDTVSFNERSMDIRNARLAQSLYNLDEDLPHGIDDSIKKLMKAHELPQLSALGPMEFLDNEDYLEYKSNLAAKRALEQPLPKSSKSHKFTHQALKGTNGHTRSTTLISFQPTPAHLLFRNSYEAKEAYGKELLKAMNIS